MNAEIVMANFKKNSVKRRLNDDEIKQLCSLIFIPYDELKEVRELRNEYELRM
jgi:hypothetical protein